MDLKSFIIGFLVFGLDLFSLAMFSNHIKNKKIDEIKEKKESKNNKSLIFFIFTKIIIVLFIILALFSIFKLDIISFLIGASVIWILFISYVVLENRKN